MSLFSHKQIVAFLKGCISCKINDLVFIPSKIFFKRNQIEGHTSTQFHFILLVITLSVVVVTCKQFHFFFQIVKQLLIFLFTNKAKGSAVA